MQLSGLSCILCKLDGTVSVEVKDKEYKMNELNKHMKTKFHTREAQLLRGLAIDGGSVKCPICEDKVLKATIIVKHVSEEHAEYA